MRMTLEQALQWAEKNCMPEAVGRLRSREVVATLRQRVADLEALKSELVEIGAALDDPRTDLSMTMVEVIRDLKNQCIQCFNLSTAHYEIMALKKERDEYLTECRTLTRQNGEWQEKFAAIKAVAKQWKMPDIAERLRDSCRGGAGCKCTLQEAADLIAAIDAALKGEK